MALEINKVTVSLGERTIVKDADIYVPDHKFVGIIGLNGTGKSSLLKAVYGINKYSGEIILNGKNLRNVAIKELAKSMAVLIQENVADFDFKVRDIVLLGRLPYKKMLEEDNAEDYAIVSQALTYVGMQNFADRYFTTLSGGEKQRVLIARILAQKTDFLILDEPTNHLDIKNQFQFFELIKNMSFTVLAVLHDINIASKFCDYLYVLHNSKIYKAGKPCDIVDEELLENVFGMQAKVHHLENDKIFIEYLGTLK